MAVTHTRHRRRMLARALHAHRTKDYSGSGLLLDYNGRGFNPQLGSTSGADANDPVFDIATAEAFLRMHGVDGTYVSKPDATFSGKASGTVRIIARLQSGTWRATSYFAGASLRRLSPRLDSDGKISLFLASTTNGTITTTSTAAVPNDALARLIRVTLDITAQTCTFDTAPDVSDYTTAVWTQLGAVVACNPGALGSIADLIAGGSQGSTSNLPWDGRLYGVWWFNDGALAAGVNFANPASYNAVRTTVAGVVSGTWSIVRIITTTARRPEVVLPGEGILSDAVDDYDTLAHDAAFNPALASFTATVAIRKYGNTGATQRCYGKRESSDGWSVDVSNTGDFRCTATAGANSATTSLITTTDGEVAVLVMTIDRAAQTVTLRALNSDGAIVATSDSPSIAAVGSIATAHTIRAGASHSGATPLSAAILGRAVIPGIAITRPADLARLATELLAA